ncbi:MAG: hypothetical protein OXI23_12520 [Gemmatimonadota bacterium]|nr:hypothetical protein [Gemmatimonadota bacterium]
MPKRRLDPDQAHRLLLTIQSALDDIRAGRRVKDSAVVWPAGLNRSIAVSLPLTVRTMNCLESAQSLMTGDGQLSAGELLRLPNFGTRSLRDLLFAVEAYLLDSDQKAPAAAAQDHTWLYLLFCARELSRPVATTATGSDRICGQNDSDSDQQRIEPLRGAINKKAHDDMSQIVAAQALKQEIQQMQSAQAIWQEIQHTLNPVLSVMVEVGLATKLSDLLNDKLLDIASILQTTSDLDRIQLAEAVGSAPGLASRMVERLEQRIRLMPERELTIIKGRILREPSMTLESIGKVLGVTRERIRQIQTKIERDIEHDLGEELELLAKISGTIFAPIVPAADMKKRLCTMLAADQGLEGKLFRSRLISEMGYEPDGEMFVSAHVKAAIVSVRDIATTCADDAGLVDEDALTEEVRKLAPELIEHWDWLKDRVGLHQLHGQIALRSSAKADAKAALKKIGRPATKQEVGKLCGMTAVKVGGAFSNIQSVVRADLERWALREWVDDEYEGISEEIIQRIVEDGGATTIDRLVTELPEKFGVSRISVRAYMQSPRFVVNDGWISLASKSSIRLRDLDDVIDGRDCTGAPYWTFSVEARYFDGYSATYVPPEFAKALGCEPDSGVSVRIGNLPGFRDLSIRWSLTSITGASMGYIGDPLKHLGLEPGERVRVIIKGPSLVHLVPDKSDSRRSEDDRGANATLDRIMRRRKVL